MIDKILDRFARSPLGRKLEAEQQAEDAARRREVAAQRGCLRADFDRRHPPLLEAQATAEARERALEAELLDARQARAAAARAVMAASLTFDAQDAPLVGRLRATADPRIRELRWRLLARGEAARAATQTNGPHPGVLDPGTLRRPEQWHSNAAENRRVTEAVATARQLLDDLEIEVLEEAALLARLHEIDAAVPMPTDTVPAPQPFALTPAEARELGWRLAEQEGRR